MRIKTRNKIAIAAQFRNSAGAMKDKKRSKKTRQQSKLELKREHLYK